MTDKKRSAKEPAELLLLLLLVSVAAVGVHGPAVLARLAVGVAAACFADYAGNLLLRNKNTLPDLTAALTGLIAALLLPADASLWLALLAAGTSIIVGRLPFGDPDRLPFVPAAVGAALTCVMYPQAFFAYPAASGGTVSAASLLKQGVCPGATSADLLAALSGGLPAAAGCGCILVLLCCLPYLLLRMPRRFLTAFGFLLVCAGIAVVFPAAPGPRLIAAAWELGSGMLVFTAVFLLPFPHLRLRGTAASLLYGLLGGLIYMLLRRFGVREESAPFAVLLTNALAPLLEQKQTQPEGGAADGA